MNTAGVLFAYGVVFLFAAVNIVNIVAHRRRKRRDDLMALADSLRMCGAVGTARDDGPHRMHACGLGLGHTDPMHYCHRCGQYWRTPAADAQEIAQLDRMLGAQAYEPDRRHR